MGEMCQKMRNHTMLEMKINIGWLQEQLRLKKQVVSL